MAYRVCPMSKNTILIIWAYAIRPYVSDLKGFIRPYDSDLKGLRQILRGFATDFERVGEICHKLGDLSHQNGREMVRKVGFWQISTLNLHHQNNKNRNNNKKI